MEGCAVGQSSARGHFGGPRPVPIPKMLIWDGGGSGCLVTRLLCSAVGSVQWDQHQATIMAPAFG